MSDTGLVEFLEGGEVGGDLVGTAAGLVVDLVAAAIEEDEFWDFAAHGGEDGAGEFQAVSFGDGGPRHVGFGHVGEHVLGFIIVVDHDDE